MSMSVIFRCDDQPESFSELALYVGVLLDLEEDVGLAVGIGVAELLAEVDDGLCDAVALEDVDAVGDVLQQVVGEFRWVDVFFAPGVFAEGVGVHHECGGEGAELLVVAFDEA